MNEDDKTKYVNDKHSKLPIHDKLKKKQNPNEIAMKYDGNSLYLSAMWDEESFYSKIESGFAF